MRNKVGLEQGGYVHQYSKQDELKKVQDCTCSVSSTGLEKLGSNMEHAEGMESRCKFSQCTESNLKCLST